MLSERIVDTIKKVAQDRFVQIACVNAMFNECERGGDLWESLECDHIHFSNETNVLLWGKPSLEDETDEDEDREETIYPDSLYCYGNVHEVIDCLLNEVERQIQKTILRNP